MSILVTRKEQIRNIFLMVLILVGILGFIKCVCFLSEKLDIGIPCVVNEILGVSCPTCGMTRAIIAISKLDFYQAIRYNAFSVMFVILGVGYILVKAYEILFNRKIFINIKCVMVISIILIVLLVAYGIIRNLPSFHILLPTKII